MGGRPIVSRETLTLAQLQADTLAALRTCYEPRESRALFRRLLAHFLPDWQTQWLCSQGLAPFPTALLPSWQEALNRLLAYEPLAYITGKVEFLDLSLAVRPGVFIPRPETESWVYALIQQLKPKPPKTILDIGTGSGAIVLALARAFPEAKVYAVEKSPLALEVARQNATQHGAVLTLAQLSFGEEPLPRTWPTRWDLIVSNPPYIPHEAYTQTELRVRLYEPHEALFCEDIEPTQKILSYASENLSENGLCVVEIFPPASKKIVSFCKSLGLTTYLQEDLSGQARSVWACQ